MIEVELKAALDARQPVELVSALSALGFSEQAAVQESDVYYNGCGRDFRRTDEALRLRSVTALPDGGTQTCITYKSPKLDTASSTRLELETAVADAAVMHALLLALGFREAFTVEKTRRSFTRGAQTVCLDAVEGLGSYMELEELLPDGAPREPATESLLSLLDTLGVSRSALTRKSYLVLLMEAATA